MEGEKKLMVSLNRYSTFDWSINPQPFLSPLNENSIDTRWMDAHWQCYI